MNEMFKQKTPCLSDEEISQLKANQLCQLDKKNEDIKMKKISLQLWQLQPIGFHYRQKMAFLDKIQFFLITNQKQLSNNS